MKKTEYSIDEVFRQHRSKMRQLAGLLLRDDDAADDAVSEVWLRLCGVERPLDGVENVEGFLLAAVRNHCLNALKSHKRSSALILPPPLWDLLKLRMIRQKQTRSGWRA